MANSNNVAEQIKSLSRSDLESISVNALDTIQQVMQILKNTGHDHLLTDLITSRSTAQAKKKLSDVKDAATIINEDTCSSMTKIADGEWTITSPLIDVEIDGTSAFDVIIEYIRYLEEEIMDKTYEKDIRATMNIALSRAKENMDGTNSGRELFDKAGVRVWLEVRISNNVPRWIVDSDEKGSTLIHRSDEDAIVRVVSGMITGNYRKSKKKETDN